MHNRRLYRMMKPHNEDSQSLKLDIIVRRQLDRNTFMVKLANFFSQCEIGFSIYLCKTPRMSYVIGLLRSTTCLYLLIKFFLFSMLRCRSERLRFYMLDWTVLYPPRLRVCILRMLATIAIGNMLMKRNYLSLDYYDPMIEHFLCQDPRDWSWQDEGLHSGADGLCELLPARFRFSRKKYDNDEISYSHSSIMICNSKYRTESHGQISEPAMVKRAVDYGSDFSWLKLRKYFVQGSYFGKLKLLLVGAMNPVRVSPEQVFSIRNFRFHSTANWLELSKRTYARFKLVTVSMVCLFSQGIVFGFLRVGFLLEDPHACGRFEEWMRIVGILDLTLLILDCLFMLIGVIAQVSIVYQYLIAHIQFTLDYMAGCLDASSNRKSSGSQPVVVRGSSAKRRLANNNLSSTQQLQQAEQLVEVERRLVEMLTSIDTQKQIMSVILSSLYWWMLYSLSFIPLFLALWRSPHRDSTTSVAIAVYLIVLSASICSPVAVSILSARIAYMALKANVLMFRLCARFPGHPIHRKWATIYLKWYHPLKCTFRVGSSFHVDYINVMRLLSYGLSGVSFTVNLIDRSGFNFM